ncbi:hypothetical protein HMPREF9019_2077 [Hoylesella timonensis CRIS 5C-B1]|uniref:Uncharacterized protein n=1 Tax=Hoylesella timonensis CRIS 5C-B1 TaxID=679189 RepID=D1VZQ1_9BACT|nr:hypothetical protein HMPREF9019_2077 [Hoylesella timonensis CRIS 5C-B1]
MMSHGYSELAPAFSSLVSKVIKWQYHFNMRKRCRNILLPLL